MRIKEAAVRHEGEIFTGRNHKVAIFKAITKTRIAPVLTVNQGFVTECGKFVGRTEAARIAFEAGQIPERKDCLYSEDLSGD